ncbi:MAG TPA: VOC family protein [Pseudonocardiaceae bacterium]|nr:VOC family protein [Pseudonocardiaceae bacterium]
MPKITPNFWFDDEAEEAAEFYTNIFKNSGITNVARPGAGEPVMWVDFELDGVAFTALNGGPAGFQFNESLSLIVNCDSQDEVDYFWEKLGAGGEFGVCGWLKDRYGVSWQIIPTAMNDLMTDSDPGRAGRATQAMLQMTKIDIETLKIAYDG